MSDLKEYIVIVNKFEDKSSLHDEIINAGGSEYVPSRAVECNLNPLTSRNTHYMMTDEEAELIKQDPRVWEVSRTWQDLGLTPVHFGVSYTQTSNHFSKNDSQASTDINWALLEVLEGQNRFDWGDDSPIQLFDVTASITVPFSGNNVDIVVVDGHADPAHPEFAVNPDGSGGSRYNQINWLGYNTALYNIPNGTYVYTPYGGSAAAAISSTLEANNNHGTHVASSCAGNTLGWARSANIYNIGFGFTDSNQFDFGAHAFINSYFLEYVKYWHQNKAVNPSTGTRNPTVCTNSWGYGVNVALSSITSVTYQGTLYTAPAGGFTAVAIAQYGVPCFDGVNCFIPTRYTPIESQMEDLIAAGVIVVAAAGNNGTYAALDSASSTDVNYNNYFSITSGGTYYYNRGTSPGSAAGVICVGAISAQIETAKAYFSNCGPRVDLYSPGFNITGAFSTQAGLSAEGYPNGVADSRNSSYYIGKLNGTSQATPQVTGVIACLLEAFPTAQQAAALSYMTTNAKSGQMVNNQFIYNNFDYSDIQNGNNRVLYAAFPSAPTATVAQSSVVATAGVNTAFTPVTGSGGFGALTYTLNSQLPAGISATGWVEAIPGSLTSAYFHVVSGASGWGIGDHIFGDGFYAPTWLASPTDATYSTWLIQPGYSSNIGSAGSPITVSNGMFINSATGEITGTPAGTLSNTSYTVTVTDGNGNASSANFNLQVVAAKTYTATYEVSYGSDPQQTVDIYVPSGTPAGVILWIHGGGWSGGSKSSHGYTTSQGGYWINDEHQMNSMAKLGYYIVAMDYRLANSNTGQGTTGAGDINDYNNYTKSGGSSNNYFPNNVNDVETVLGLMMVSGGGSTWSTVRNAVNTYGLLVSGESAGGHLSSFAVQQYLYTSGNYPSNGVAPIVGPQDADIIANTDPTVSTIAQNILNNYINGITAAPSEAQEKAISPRWQYGTIASPGPWHSAVYNSSLKFWIYYNPNDTLVVPSLQVPFYNTLQSELGNNRVYVEAVAQGAFVENSNYPNHNLQYPICVYLGDLAQRAFAILSTVNVTSKITTAGTAVTPFTPVAFRQGAGVITYSISPGLPSGLNFSHSTGAISGTPSSSSQTTTYTITGTDASGKSVSATFNLAVQAASGGGGVGLQNTVITHQQWNTLQSKVASIIGNPDSSTVDLGWGVPSNIQSSPVSQGSSPSGDIYGTEYDHLVHDINYCLTHISNSVYSQDGTRDAHQLITNADYAQLSTQIDYLYSNRTTVSPVNLTSTAWSQHATFSFSNSWGYHYRIDFGSNKNFRSFWNGGGSISWNLSLVPNADPISQGFHNLASGVGTFTLTRTGFTQSNNSPLYSISPLISGGAYGGNLAADPNPFTTGGVQAMFEMTDHDANYTNNGLAVFISLDNADPFQAQAVAFVVEFTDNYHGQGGFTVAPGGTWGVNDTISAPFGITAVHNNGYFYVDGGTTTQSGTIGSN